MNLLGINSERDATHERLNGTTIVDYRPVDDTTIQIIRVVDMPSNLEEIVIDNVNLDLQYRDFYTVTTVNLNDFITVDNIKFKIYKKANWGAYNLLSGEEFK